MVDSGAARNVCFPSWEPDIELVPLPQKRNLQAANGQEIQTHGLKNVNIFVGKKGFIPAAFLVSQVQNPILAVVQLQSQGLETVSKPTTAFIKFPRSNKVVDLVSGHGLPARLEAGQDHGSGTSGAD
eukprot:14865434-Alexandrium_andersonii.AAC.1